MSEKIPNFKRTYEKGVDGKVAFEESLRQIKSGKKNSCWAWWIWPTKRPSKAYGCDYNLDDEEARKFMDDKYLRTSWLRMMDAVATNIEKGVSAKDLAGIDDWRIYSTCELFLRTINKDKDYYPRIIDVSRRIANATNKLIEKKKYHIEVFLKKYIDLLNKMINEYDIPSHKEKLFIEIFNRITQILHL